MEKQIRTESRINQIACILFLSLAVLTSGHVYSVARDSYINYIILFMVGIIALYVFIYIRPRSMPQSSSRIALLIFATGLINMVFDILFGNRIFYGMKFPLILVFSFLFTLTIDFERFKKMYTYVIAVIAGFSLIGHIYGMFFNFRYPFPILFNINGTRYYNAYIFYALDDFSRGRNIGVFWEPGIFALFLAIALVFHIYDAKKINIPILIVLFASLVSTYSTTGYFLMAIILFSFVYLRKQKGILSILMISSGVILIIVSLMFSGGFFNFFLENFPRVFRKLVDRSASTTVRTDAIIYNLQNYLVYPVTGSGISNANLLYSQKTSSAQTSGMTLYFAQFGVVGIYFVWLQFKSVLMYPVWTISQKLLFALMWIIIMNTQITTFFSLIYIIIFYFINEAHQTTKMLHLHKAEKGYDGF